MAKVVDPANGEGQQEPRKLTPKQEAFAREYVKCGNASEAYRRSYNVGEDTKPNVIAVKASELLKNGNVTVRVDELQERAAKVATLDRAWILDRLMRNADEAIKAQDFTASNKAIELLGKTDEIGSMFTDKVESKTNLTGTMTVTSVDRPPAETREQWIERRKRELAASAPAVATPARAAN